MASPSNTVVSAYSTTSRKPWKCRSHPEIHPRLHGHTLAQHSCVGTAKWQQDGPVVNTTDWFIATRGSIRRQAKDPGRDQWVWSGKGAIHGQPSQLDPPVFGWTPHIPKALQGISKSMLEGGSVSAGELRRSSSICSRTSVRSGGKGASTGFGGSHAAAAAAAAASASQGSGGSKTGQRLPDLLAGEFTYPPSPAYVRTFLRNYAFEND